MKTAILAAAAAFASAQPQNDPVLILKDSVLPQITAEPVAQVSVQDAEATANSAVAEPVQVGMTEEEKIQARIDLTKESIQLYVDGPDAWSCQNREDYEHNFFRNVKHRFCSDANIIHNGAGINCQEHWTDECKNSQDLHVAYDGAGKPVNIYVDEKEWLPRILHNGRAHNLPREYVIEPEHERTTVRDAEFRIVPGLEGSVYANVPGGWLRLATAETPAIQADVPTFFTLDGGLDLPMTYLNRTHATVQVDESSYMLPQAALESMVVGYKIPIHKISDDEVTLTLTTACPAKHFKLHKAELDQAPTRLADFDCESSASTLIGSGMAAIATIAMILL